MNDIIWTPIAWEDFSSLVASHETKSIKQVFKLITDIQRNGVDKGIGKPEPLKYEMAGYWSREITGKDRLVYRVDDEGVLHIIQCKTHYHKGK